MIEDKAYHCRHFNLIKREIDVYKSNSDALKKLSFMISIIDNLYALFSFVPNPYQQELYNCLSDLEVRYAIAIDAYEVYQDEDSIVLDDNEKRFTLEEQTIINIIMLKIESIIQKYKEEQNIESEQNDY